MHILVHSLILWWRDCQFFSIAQWYLITSFDWASNLNFNLLKLIANLSVLAYEVTLSQEEYFGHSIMKMSLGLVIWFKYGRLLNLHQNLYGQKVTFNLAQYRLTVEDVFNSSLAGWSVRIQTGMNILKKILAPTVPKFITIWLQFHRWRS